MLTGKRLYTLAADERVSAVTERKFTFEKITGYLFDQPTTQHLYTTSDKESAEAVQTSGYGYEGASGYLLRELAAGAVPFYRLFDGRERLYTSSQVERDTLVTQGRFKDEGVAGYVFTTQVVGSVPLFRMANSDEHVWVLSQAERDNAVAQGWYVGEGIACYVYPAAAPDRIPFHRHFTPRTAFYRLVNTNNEYLYTSDAQERDSAIAIHNYRLDNQPLAGYIFSSRRRGQCRSTGYVARLMGGFTLLPRPNAIWR